MNIAYINLFRAICQFVQAIRVYENIGKFARKLKIMADYTTELLHISSYVIGILLGALICTIVTIFYYRKQLRSAVQADDERLLFPGLDFQENTTSDLEATPTGEGAGEADAAALEEERTEEKESGRLSKAKAWKMMTR